MDSCVYCGAGPCSSAECANCYEVRKRLNRFLESHINRRYVEETMNLTASPDLSKVKGMFQSVISSKEWKEGERHGRKRALKILISALESMLMVCQHIPTRSAILAEIGTGKIMQTALEQEFKES